MYLVDDTARTFRDFGGKSLSAATVREISVDGLVVLWDRYKRERWNDSQYVNYHTLSPISCLTYNGELCTRRDHRDWEWRHKQPTFEGFIEWLSKRKRCDYDNSN